MHSNPSKAKIAFGCPVLLYKSLTEINPLKPQRDGKAPRVFVQEKKKSRSSSESIIPQWFMSTLKGYFKTEIRKSSALRWI